MAPAKPSKAIKSPKTSSKPRAGTRTSSKSSAPITKSRKGDRGQPPKQVKTKPGAHVGKVGNVKSNGIKKTKGKDYTDKELGLPTLNMITPAGVQKPRGKKKGKIFVDDQESMMAILAVVNAEKEGQIESKIMKARHMEEIRESKRKEAELRQEERKSNLEAVKDSLRRKKSSKSGKRDAAETTALPTKTSSGKKRVSFA